MMHTDIQCFKAGLQHYKPKRDFIGWWAQACQREERLGSCCSKAAGDHESSQSVDTFDCLNLFSYSQSSIAPHFCTIESGMDNT